MSQALHLLDIRLCHTISGILNWHIQVADDNTKLGQVQCQMEIFLQNRALKLQDAMKVAPLRASESISRSLLPSFASQPDGKIIAEPK